MAYRGNEDAVRVSLFARPQNPPAAAAGTNLILALPRILFHSQNFTVNALPRWPCTPSIQSTEEVTVVNKKNEFSSLLHSPPTRIFSVDLHESPFPFRCLCKYSFTNSDLDVPNHHHPPAPHLRRETLDIMYRDSSPLSPTTWGPGQEQGAEQHWQRHNDDGNRNRFGLCIK